MFVWNDCHAHSIDFFADLQGVNLSVVALFRADGTPALVQINVEVLIVSV